MSNITKAIAALGVVAGLGVAAMPLSTYAVTSQPVTITAEVSDSLGINVSDTTVNLGTIVAGQDVRTGTVDVTVTGTATNGYKLTIKDAAANAAMIKTGTDGLPAANIPAVAPAKDNAGWGVIAGGNWKAVPASTAAALQLNSTTGNITAANGLNTVTFGVSAGDDTESGVYTTDVVFTATAN